MAFDVSELAAIRGTLDKFCSRRSSQSLDGSGVRYEIDGHAVTLFGVQPDVRDPATLVCDPFARLRYYRSRHEWMLYWVRADGKWHLYEPASPARRLSTLVRHVDRDNYGCFFG